MEEPWRNYPVDTSEMQPVGRTTCCNFLVGEGDCVSRNGNAAACLKSNENGAIIYKCNPDDRDGNCDNMRLTNADGPSPCLHCGI